MPVSWMSEGSSFPSRGSSKCKGPLVEIHLVHWRISNKSSETVINQDVCSCICIYNHVCAHTHHEGGRRRGQRRNSQNIKVLIEKGVWLHVEHHGKSLEQLRREHELGYTSGYTIMTGKRSKRRQEGNLIGYHSVLCERWQRNRLEHHQKKSGSGCHDNGP